MCQVLTHVQDSTADKTSLQAPIFTTMMLLFCYIASRYGRCTYAAVAVRSIKHQAYACGRHVESRQVHVQVCAAYCLSAPTRRPFKGAVQQQGRQNARRENHTRKPTCSVHVTQKKCSASKKGASECQQANGSTCQATGSMCTPRDKLEPPGTAG